VQGSAEDEEAAAPRVAAIREGRLTTALSVTLGLRAAMTVPEAAAVVTEAVEAGLAAIEDESPGMVAVGGKPMRDRLELVAWRVAGNPGWPRRGPP
jgi:hypothetical protein